MKRSLIWACFGVAAIWLLCASPATAQEMVYNGDLETGSYTHGWTLFGGNANTKMATFQTKYNVNSLCLKRRPGPPSDNGGLETDVHLIGGETYLFTANIAAEYCSS
jgi:hypothetical protein